MKHTYLMTLHFWIHLLRLLTTVIALVMTIWLTARPPVLRGRLSPGTPADFIPLANKLYARSILVCKILFALLIPLLLNDSLMLTFDYYRTDTYFGSVMVQTGLSIAALALAPTALGIWSPMDDFKYFQAWFLWWRPVWPTLLGCIMLWSVCSVGTLCWATLLPPRPITLQQIWKYNTKDVLLGAAASNKSSQVAPLPSIAGRPRDTPISAKQELHPVTAPPRRFITRVLFRRVSPAESRLYALTRNAFAAFAIFIIIFRAIVALSQAGNKIETRLQSKPCSNYQPMVETRIFMTDMSGTNQDSNEVSAINMTTDGGWSQACTVDHLGTEHRAKPSLDEPEFSRYNIFSCYLSTSFNGIPVSYDITVRSLNGSVLRKYSPLLWMLHNQDLDHSQNLSVASIMKDAAPAYTPAWKLRRGYHLEGEARIVKRRVITSSVWRDLLINLDPQYAEISLYPITLTSATRLANETVASARLRISFDSSFSFLGDEKKIWNPKDGLLSTSPPVVCDTIEDYRSSTVMDVIGSVGGLFALLQAAHILLFGRPLLWGLTGAKLITPFGLIGACSSQAFKRRLREQYRRQPTDDNPDPIQIGTFLRDFVIDFGPAGADATQRESRGTRNHDSFYEEQDRSESAGVRVPLMQVPSSSSPSFEAPFSIDKGTTAGTHGRDSEIV